MPPFYMPPLSGPKLPTISPVCSVNHVPGLYPHCTQGLRPGLKAIPPLRGWSLCDHSTAPAQNEFSHTVFSPGKQHGDLSKLSWASERHLRPLARTKSCSSFVPIRLGDEFSTRCPCRGIHSIRRPRGIPCTQRIPRLHLERQPGHGHADTAGPWHCSAGNLDSC